MSQLAESKTKTMTITARKGLCFFRKDTNKVAAKLFFEDNLKKTLNLARTQRNERTKRDKARQGIDAQR